MLAAELVDGKRLLVPVDLVRAHPYFSDRVILLNDLASARSPL